MRYALPSPFEELPHTADVGVRACGADRTEALARAALAVSQLQSGGGAVEPRNERRLIVRSAAADDLPVDLAREVLGRFYEERLLLAAIEIERLKAGLLEARGWFGPFDPERHGEGLDIKAVTYARTGFQAGEGGRVFVSLIFDI